MTLQETIRALHEYAATEQTGPDETDLASEFRAHVGQSVIELLRAHGSLRGLPETSQVSLFEMGF